MGGQAAEQIIAGVVLSERLAVTMYGAIHRAQFGGQRNLRGLVVDPKIVSEEIFRVALTDPTKLTAVTRLEHASIVPTVAVESAGPEVVVVTRGVGRYVTVQDLIAAAKAKTRQGGKLSMPIAALIGRSVIEALAAAHRVGVIHGAVHPRSVLIDEDGGVRLTDFVIGRALSTAVAQGADSSLWRGLTGFIAPELVVGEDPAPGVDVFAVGAMLYTMLSGELPPGSLRVTPAVERLVSRALDTDVGRRYKSASDLLENLLEAMEDDHWEVADRGELIREAGLSQTDTNIDDATEDLLASLTTGGPVQVTPLLRAGAEMHSEVAAMKQQVTPTGDRLNALLADLGDTPAVRESTRDSRRREAVAPPPRVPSLDDPDDDPPPPPPRTKRTGSADENAALAAIDSLDPPRAAAPAPAPTPAAPRAQPIVMPEMADLPTPKLKSPLRGAAGAALLIGVLGAAGYGVMYRFSQDDAQAAAAKEAEARAAKDSDDKLKAARDALPDRGAIEITADGAGVWLLLGKTPFDSAFNLPATQQHDIALIKDGFAPTETQINGTSWTGTGPSLAAKLSVPLKPGKSGKPTEIPLQPTTTVLGTTGIAGAGPVHLESSPAGAEAWLFIGANHARFDDLWAGRDYECAVVKPGFKTEHVMFKTDDWRDRDPTTPIDSAKKKAVLTSTVELQPEPRSKH